MALKKRLVRTIKSIANVLNKIFLKTIALTYLTHNATCTYLLVNYRRSKATLTI